MELRDIGALASLANTIGVSALLLLALKLIDAGRWVRGVDLEKCQKEVDRLHRLIERRFGLHVIDEIEADDLVINGEHHAGPTGRP